MRYTVESTIVRDGIRSEAEDLIQKRLQPMLDDGAKKGWKLASFSHVAVEKGIRLILIWEIE